MTRASRVPQPTLDLSRRSLFGAVLGIGALATLQACGGDAEGGSGGDGGGTVKWAWQMPTTWDPVTSSAGSDVQMLALTYSALTFIDNQGNAQPNLVESWEYAKDGKSVSFTLKDGLVFSDGSPIDAEAVKKSLERGRDADNSLIAAQLADLTNVTADDDLTFTLELAGPNYQYPILLAGKTGMVVNPAVFEADPDSLATQPAGSGPFVLDSYVQNSKAVLHKNDKYFEADGITITNFELYPAAEAATVVASLQSGQYNVGLLPGSQLEAAKAAGLEVQVMPSLYVATLDVNKTMKPFDDPKVVEALHFAVDRQALVDTGEFGLGEVAYQPFPDGYVGYNPELDGIYAYDPDKAASILKEAGYTKPIPLTISTSNPEGVPELLQAQLSQGRLRAHHRDHPAGPVHPAGLHQPREGAGRRLLRRPRVARAGLPGALQRHRPDEPGPRVRPRRQGGDREGHRHPAGRPGVRRAVAGGDQGRGHLDAQHLPLQPAARGGPGQGRLRAARAPRVGDLGRRHGLVSAAISVTASASTAPSGRRAEAGCCSPSGRSAGCWSSRRPCSCCRRSSRSRWAPCRERTRRPRCSARRRRPRTSRG